MSRNIKSVITYTAAAIFAFVFDRVYSLFSHGVGSKSMSSMWIWLLCSGSTVYLLMELISIKTKKQIPSRLSMNIYNSGSAVFVAGMLIQGILEIAGTGSDYLLWYKTAGIALMVIGSLSILVFKKTPVS